MPKDSGEMKFVNLAIWEEVRRTRGILEERGFRPTRLEVLNTVTVDVGADNRGECRTLSLDPWVLSLNEIDQSWFRGVILTEDEDDETIGNWEIGKSWCAVMIDPASTDLDWWGQICAEILLHLYVEKDFWGYVLIQSPKPTGWNTPDGWYFSALFMDEAGCTRWIWNLDRSECYPWRAHLEIFLRVKQQARYLITCRSQGDRPSPEGSGGK